MEELLTIYYRDNASETQQNGSSQQPAEEGDPRVAAESAHWQVVQVCLDAYAQRMSACQTDLAYTYDIMLNLGALLLKNYPDRLRNAPEEQREPEF